MILYTSILTLQNKQQNNIVFKFNFKTPIGKFLLKIKIDFSLRQRHSIFFFFILHATGE